jgi:hypothetical protein
MVERASRSRWSPPTCGGRSPKPRKAPKGVRRAVILVLGVAAIGASALGLGLYGVATSAHAPNGAVLTAHDAALTALRAHVAIGAASPTTTTTTSPTAPAAVTISPSTAPAPPSTTAVVAALISEVESAGVDPGPHWSWAMGDTAAACGAIAGGTLATGCTSWSFGTEKTVFAGAPPLALVAHELANAEAEADATPSLLSQVAAAEAGTSWSPIDAVSSCLVEHFLGFQDNAAGTWQCPTELASLVAEDIHETTVTNQTNASCGTTSGISSTLTFVGSAGTLTVTTPAPGSTPQTVGPEAPVTVSGIGSFTAVDQGGTITLTGTCEA